MPAETGYAPSRGYAPVSAYAPWVGGGGVPPPPPPPTVGTLNFFSPISPNNNSVYAAILTSFRSAVVEIPYSFGWIDTSGAASDGSKAGDRQVPVLVTAKFKKSTEWDGAWTFVDNNNTGTNDGSGHGYGGWRNFVGTSRNHALWKVEDSTELWPRSFVASAVLLDPGTTYDFSFTITENLTTLAWSAGRHFYAGQIVHPTVDNGFYFTCTTGGVAGGSEPAWNAVLSATTSDGAVTWTTMRKNGTVTLGGSGVAAYQATTQTDTTASFHNITDFSVGSTQLAALAATWTHYYVNAGTGSDANNGALATPFATIGKACQTINALPSGSNTVVHVASGQYQCPDAAHLFPDNVNYILKPPANSYTLFAADNPAVDGTPSDGLSRVMSAGSTYRDANGYLKVRQLLNSGNRAIISPLARGPGGWVLTAFPTPSEYLTAYSGTNINYDRFGHTSGPMPATLYMWKKAGLNLHPVSSADAYALLLATSPTADYVRNPGQVTQQKTGSFNDSHGQTWYLDSAPDEAHFVASIRLNGGYRHGVFTFNGNTYAMPEPWTITTYNGGGSAAPLMTTGGPNNDGFDECGIRIVDMNQLYYWVVEQDATANHVGYWYADGPTDGSAKVRFDGFQLRANGINVSKNLQHWSITHCLFDEAEIAAGSGVVSYNGPTAVGSPGKPARNLYGCFQFNYIRQSGSTPSDHANTRLATTGACDDPSVPWSIVKLDMPLADGTDGKGPFNKVYHNHEHPNIGGNPGSAMESLRWNYMLGGWDCFGGNVGSGDKYTFFGRNSYDNIITRHNDNPWENDGSIIGHADWGNDISLSLAPNSTAPGNWGPILFFNNLVHNWGGANQFDLIIPNLSWTKVPQGQLFKYGQQNNPQRAVAYIVNNTMWSDQPAPGTSPGTGALGTAGTNGANQAGTGSYHQRWYVYNNIMRSTRIMWDITRGTRLQSDLAQITAPGGVQGETILGGTGNKWTASTVAPLYALCIPVNSSTYGVLSFMAVVSGTTGTVEPNWSTTSAYGDTVTDGSVTWVRLAHVEPLTWWEDYNMSATTDSGHGKMTLNSTDWLQPISNYRTAMNAREIAGAGLHSNAFGGADRLFYAASGTTDGAGYLDSQLVNTAPAVWSTTTDPSGGDFRVTGDLVAAGAPVDNICDIRKPAAWSGAVPEWMYTGAAPNLGFQIG